MGNFEPDRPRGYKEDHEFTLGEKEAIKTAEKLIRLSITNFYGIRVSVPIPIYHPKNWTTMIADMIERNINII
jgi:hypothetical protein